MKNSIFLHIPKTGGSWVKKALTEATDIVVRRSGRWHSIPRDPKLFSKFWFCFVRHPQTWYQSFWSFNIRENKWANGPCNIIAGCAHKDFNTFVMKVIGRYPRGFLSNYLYPRFTRECDFVGRYETLAEDTIKALTLAGETFDPQRIRDISSFHRNAAAQTPEYADKCLYRDDVLKKLLEAESPAIRSYYGS